ncbi:MAG: hypothetical protein QHH00_05540 [Methanomassiliicoccales archaeon]|jgi:hypothetical protein|nr:hypothetical protein [Methanomassiliicoccales archaeon]
MTAGDFVQRIRKQTEQLREIEGACGICHGTLEAITSEGGSVSAYERPNGILATIKDDSGNEIGRGFDIVWSPAVLAAEIDADLVPRNLKESLREDALTHDHEIDAVADLFGYGRVLTPSVIALQYINDIGGRTLIRREGLGVVARMFDKNDQLIVTSSVSYCPTCAIAKAAARSEVISSYVKERLSGARNTGRLKFERNVENRYEAKGGAVRTSIYEGDRILADRVLGCCIAYSTTKAEIAAGFIPPEGAKRFKAYCNLCPMKHCWMEKSMGAMGNIVLHRLSEIGTEIEVSANGLIIARIPGKETIQGRGTLCSLSALTNMLITSDGSKVLKPSPARRFPGVRDEKENQNN